MEKTNARSVLVSIKGNSNHDQSGQKDEIALMTSGSLTKTQEGFELRYDEVEPDSQEVSHTLVTATPGKVVMEKVGDYHTSMVFEKGKKYQSHYNTPYGALEMSIYPIMVKHTLSETDGEIFLKYQLNIQENFMTLHEIEITYLLQTEG